MPSALPAVTQSPAREVAVARQPVLDGDANLLGYELLVDGAAVVVDALSEVGLDALTGGHVAWLPLGRELLVGLSHKLLRFANSALFARSQRVGSVREAMMLLGARGVQRWATVLVLAGMPDQPHVLLVTALVRARMCELIGDDPARTDRASPSACSR
jgi:c-di-GMP-related signal transduction protein